MARDVEAAFGVLKVIACWDSAGRVVEESP
jgi:hypothetical protein